MRILIIEDEYSLADAIAETLKKEKFTVDIATDGEEGKNEALTNIYDLILNEVGNNKWLGYIQNEIESSKAAEQEISNNFGKGPMEMENKGTVTVQSITTIDAVVDFTVIAQLLGIGILLSFISSLASMISIQRFSPLTILKERS